MKLDPTVMRTMSTQDFPVLEAVEKGMKNHAIVPLHLITAIANLRHGGAHKIISSLLRDKLLSHEQKKGSVDGYRLTNAGYDILALHNLKVRGFIVALGQRVGTGKESDIYLAARPDGKQIILKLHRLGRTSFRNVKKKRDYFGRATQQAHSWLFLSRLSALKEYAFMKALNDVAYPTPIPIAQSRHIVAMSLVRGLPLYQISSSQLSAEQAQSIYQQAVGLAARLVQHGLVHCDLNEFNLLVDLSGIQALATDAEDPYVRHSGQSVADEKSIGILSKPAWEQSLEKADNIAAALPMPLELLDSGEPKPVVTLIDFPQMISVKHPNAQELYERDLACLRRFFEVKLQFNIPDDDNDVVAWDSIINRGADEHSIDTQSRLDTELRASGFSADMGRGLELYYFDSGPTQQNSLIEKNESDDEEFESDGASDSDDKLPNEDMYSDVLEQVTVDVEVDNIPVCLNSSLQDSNEDGNDQAIQPSNPNGHVHDIVVDSEDLQSIARGKALELAKERVRRQLDEEKKKSQRRGAFKKGNKNKTYVKGKRVMTDAAVSW